MDRRLPGIGPVRTASFRSVLWGTEAKRLKPQGVIVDGSLSRDPLNTGDLATLRCGQLLGRITASGLYRPSIVGRSTAAYADNDTTIGVSAATATEIARIKAALGGGNLSMKFIGPPTAGGTVAETAITVTAVTINGASSTITVGDLNLAKVTDSLLTLADGSEYPRGIQGKEDGLEVADEDGDSFDTYLSDLIIGGLIDTGQIVDYPADASTKAWIKTKLRAYGVAYSFNDDF